MRYSDIVRKLTLLCGIWSSFWVLRGQVELNVKFNSQAATLASFLRAHGDEATLSSERNILKTEFPFLTHLQSAKSLTIQSESLPISGIFTLRFEIGTAFSIIQELEQSGLVEYAEPNKRRILHTVTPDDDSITAQWHHPRIQTFEAWEYTKGSSNIKVGVIDTGLDYGHPDFEGQLFINTLEDRNHNGTFEAWNKDEIRNGKSGDFDGIDQDGNGYADDVIGYDFSDTPRSPVGGDYLYPDADPMDEHFHGTFVSGIISAKDNNKQGGAGIAPNCKLVVLKAFGIDGGGEDDDIARAIVYAADNGIQVLNLSFGDAYPSLMMRDAIRYADSKGVIIVASAGNGTGDDLHYPSGFDPVISVSATAPPGRDGKEYLWQLSSYGWTVSLAAPGAGIFSTTLRDTVEGVWVEYMRASGTSASAPMVSAAAALLLSQRPLLTPQQVRGILCNGADDVMELGWDHFTGAGRLNILQSLQTVGSANVQILSPSNDTGSAAEGIWIRGTVIEPQLKDYVLEYQAGVEGVGEWKVIIQNQLFQIIQDTLGYWDISNLPEGDYVLRLRVNKTNGYTMEDRVRFVRDKSAPEIKIKAMSPILDNQERKFYIAFRASDRGTHTLFLRKAGGEDYFSLTSDKLTRGGEFLIGKSLLKEDGVYEGYLSTQNEAGLIGQSDVFTFIFEQEQVEMSGVKQLKHSLPMGAFVPEAFDFDGDGLKEAVTSKYNDRLSYGKVFFYEYNLSGFTPADSVTIKNILIPKSVSDVDNDGLKELLCTVNDSSYMLTQAGSHAFPTKVKWENLGGGKYASRFADIDNDGVDEILLKDFMDYFVWKKSGDTYTQFATLPDVTPNYVGSIASRTLVGDFDSDGKKEVIFGDYDGEFVIYEYDGSGGFALTYTDTTEWLYKSGEYLVQGDFDGDGKLEFFVATHPLPGLRNGDNEYDPLAVHLRIFKASGDNMYQMVWEDYLYDIDSDGFTCATAGNIDNDLEAEILFTTFPRTYILEFVNGSYEFTWFYYGTLATHHIIGDFNNNGVNEFGLGRGDSTLMFEREVFYSGPQPVTTLEGLVLDESTTYLTWQSVPNAVSYQIFRQESGTSNAVLVGTTTQPFFRDSQLVANKRYLYGLITENQNLSPTESEFSNIVSLRPHKRNRIDSVYAVTPYSIRVFFSESMTDGAECLALFTLDYTHSPISIIQSGANSLILGFAQEMGNGTHLLSTDTLLLDRDLGRLNVQDTLKPFEYFYLPPQSVYFTHWEIVNEKQGLLHYNIPMKEGVLVIENYSVSPFGEIAGLEWEGNDKKSVRFTLNEPLLGATGYSLSVTVSGVVALDNTEIKQGEGNTATFTRNASTLANVYVFPNPKIISSKGLYEGIYFAGIPQTATVTIYTLSGRKVNQVTESDGNGGTKWDLKDESGTQIPSGTYLFKVESAGESLIGKFTVIN